MKIQVTYRRNGKTVLMQQRYADILVKLGHVMLTPSEPAAKVAPPAVPMAAAPASAETAAPAPAPEKAADPAPAVPTPAPTPAPTAPVASAADTPAAAPKPKRAYKRRDMTAEKS